MAQTTVVEVPKGTVVSILTTKIGGKWVARVVYALFAVVLGYAIVVAVSWTFGWRPIVGPSMKPLFPVFGGFARIEKIDPSELNEGDVVVLHDGPLGRSCKRVGNVVAESLYVLGDNRNRSADSSLTVDDQRDVYIPFDCCEGRVASVWSPKRALRALFKEDGDWKNEMELKYPPSRIYWSPSGQSALVKRYDLSVALMTNDRDTELGEVPSMQCLDAVWGYGVVVFKSENTVVIYNRMTGKETVNALDGPPSRIEFLGSDRLLVGSQCFETQINLRTGEQNRAMAETYQTGLKMLEREALAK